MYILIKDFLQYIICNNRFLVKVINNFTIFQLCLIHSFFPHIGCKNSIELFFNKKHDVLLNISCVELEFNMINSFVYNSFL